MPSISSTNTVSIDIYFTHSLGAWGEMAGLKGGLGDFAGESREKGQRSLSTSRFASWS